MFFSPKCIATRTTRRENKKVKKGSNVSKYSSKI